MHGTKLSGRLGGKITIPSSKSVAHRMLICASLADRATTLHSIGAGDDIYATIECLNALGANIIIQGNEIHISPINRSNLNRKLHTLNCKESGSTLRFMLPLVAALGAEAEFHGEGRLPQRPLSPLYEELVRHGAHLSEKGLFPLRSMGERIKSGEYVIDGSISSQYISGLLMALPTIGGESTIRIEGRIESQPYIELTISILRMFGVDIQQQDRILYIPASATYHSAPYMSVEADWSSAAFWIVGGVIGDSPIRCDNLSYNNSVQGDRRVIDVLRSMGANIVVEADSVTAYPSKLHGISVDCADIPDLVPILAVAASTASGESIFNNIQRLRIKESNRVESTMKLLSALGIESKATENSMIIYPGTPNSMGYVESANDHRIAASAAILSTRTTNGIVVDNIKCIDKSYPDFCRDFIALSGVVERV